MRQRAPRAKDFLSYLFVILVGLGTWSLATAALAQGAQPGAQGAVKADTGFRPTPNGFNFANWGGNEKPQSDLTAEDARCLFGDRVCERLTGGRCEPTPAARMWLAEMNKGMKDGHCEGLAALSAAFFTGQRQPRTYGGQAAIELKDANAALLRSISTFFVTQYLEPVKSTTEQTQRLSTKEIVATLAQAMQARQETYTLGIYGSQGGHAITPYAVEEVGSGRFLIHVYDNNYPGVGNVVEVDTNADTWRYAGAALNPGEAASPWEGKGGSMDLTPLSVRFKPLACPFCQEPAASPMCSGGGSPQAPSAPAPGTPARPPGAPPRPPGTPARPPGAPARPPGAPAPVAPGSPAAPTSIVTNANCDQISVTDKQSKRRATFERGKMVSQIPQVGVARRRGARGCVVQLPPGAQYDVVVAGAPGQPAQPLDATVFRPGQVVSLDGATVTPGRPESIGIGDSSFSYRPGSDSKPSFAMATDNPDGTDGYYELDNMALGAGFSFSLNENENGQIIFDSDDPHLDTFDIKVRLEDEHGSQDLTFDHVNFDEHGQAILAPDDHGGLSFGMDTDSDGIPDARDPDDDNDGKPDAIDPDDDNDGIPDAQESQVHDADGDGKPDATDPDDDNDGKPDAVDTDDDNDGIADVDEPEVHDTDHDGKPDATDPDDDNDGKPDAVDTDDDNDGTPDVDEPEIHDTDHDGKPDAIDTDDDNDGKPDAVDTDDDNDGTPDVDEPEVHDTDHDGTPDAVDADDDNDGKPDATDTDDDNDGTPDVDEPEVHDTDHDGTPDAVDADDDNDGKPDATDTDDDNDGTSDAQEEDAGMPDVEEEPADDAGNDDAGNDDAGNDDAGNDDAGNDDAGNDDAGNDDPGNDDAGNDDAGNDDAGNDDAGNDDGRS